MDNVIQRFCLRSEGMVPTFTTATGLRLPSGDWVRSADYDVLLKSFETDRQNFEQVAKWIHYPECWDTAVYPTLADAMAEIAASFKCSNQDTHEAASRRSSPAFAIGGR